MIRSWRAWCPTRTGRVRHRACARERWSEPPSGRSHGHSTGRPNHRGDPSRPFETARAADYRALLRRRVRCVLPLLPAARHSILPWALFPSKVHSHSAPARVCLPGWTTATEAAAALGARPAVEADTCTAGIPLVVALRHPHRSGSVRAEPGAEADLDRRAFSARRPKPGTALQPLGAAEAVLEDEAVPPESVRRRGRVFVIRDALPHWSPPEGGFR
jgi:hypothetical protein